MRVDTVCRIEIPFSSRSGSAAPPRRTHARDRKFDLQRELEKRMNRATRRNNAQAKQRMFLASSSTR